MTNQDMYGCDITLTKPAAQTAWNKTLQGFLAHSATTPQHLKTTLNLSPQFALGHIASAFFQLLLGRKELIAFAQSALKTAQQIAAEGHISEREQSFLLALEQWFAGRPSQSAQTLSIVLKRWPHDALAMKLQHAILFMLGEAKAMRKALEGVEPAYHAKHPALGYFMGCYSFALEETGDYERAEHYGLHGLDLNPDDAWGLHAVTHVYDMTGNAKKGITWLKANEHAWQHCNNFRYHVWWHLALMHLDVGNIEEVFRLYDTEIRIDKTDDYRDISNATSLLSRLELEGIDVGNRWEELIEICEKRTDDTTLAFADLHYMLALCASENSTSASNLRQKMEQCVNSPHDLKRAISDPGLSAAKGLEAFREENYNTAYSFLRQARQNMHAIGGSHAQRDIFERITIEAAIRAGLLTQAKADLKDRETRRGFADGYSQKRFALIQALTIKQNSSAENMEISV